MMREDVLRLMRNNRSTIPVILIAALFLGGCVMRPKDSVSLPEIAAEPTPEPGPVRYRVEFRQEDLALSVQSVEEGEIPQVPAEADHARLIGWTDADGLPADPYSPVTKDTVYYAETRPLLAADSGWLLPRDHGFLMPEDAFTLRDAADALGVLLADSADAERVLSLPAGNEEDGRPLTREEFSNLLYALFDRDGAYSVLSEAFTAESDEVTRARAAYCLARLLDAEPRSDLYFPDAAPDRPDYAVLCSAAAPGGPDREELIVEASDGFLWFDGYLYRIDEEGYFLCDMEADGLYYGPNGRYTSGNEELDALVADTISRLTQNSQTRRERLRTIYLHVKNDFKYLTRNYYASGDHGWEIPEALYMYETGRGNCYCYAGMFWSLARGLGYNATAYSGTMGNQNQPHAWTEITLDGEVYICDPEIEMNYWWLAGLNGDNSMYTDNFMMLRSTAGGWNYQAADRQ